MSTYVGVLNFNAAIDRHVAGTQDRLRRVFQRTALICIGSIVDGDPGYSPGTPVDTGHARRSWHTFIAGGDVPVVPDAATQGDPVAQAIEALADLQLGQTAWCVNDVPYIVALEYGHSKKQAPFGMVRLTLSAAQEIVAQANREERAA